MKTGDRQQWFIDAWAVLDGYAFASLRAPDSIDAEVTLFVSPPYFEPEPVASLATALAATRGHFQDRFLDEDGREIAFPTLAQLIETIRRAYRAGGLDLDGGAALPGVPTPREPGRAAGAAHPADLVDPEMEAVWSKLQPVLLDDSLSREREEYLRRLLARLLECAMPALVPKFIGNAAVHMLARLSGAAGSRRELAREAMAWIAKARSIGVDVFVQREEEAILVSVVLTGSPSGFAWPVDLDDVPDSVLHSMDPSGSFLRDASGSEVYLPFTVPIDAVFQDAQRYPGIPTLGHLLAAATADRRYVKAIESAHEIVPLLVLALTQLPFDGQAYAAFPLLKGTPECRETCARAARWLAAALPSGMLEGHPAEEAVHALVVRLLTPPSRDLGRPGLSH